MSSQFPLQLKRTESKKDWADFIDFPWEIYKDSPHWVPPLKIAVKDLLDVSKNPFFRHAWMYPINAYQNGKMVGRVVGVIDENHNNFHKEKTAFFGFYECIDNQKVSDELLNAVAKWAKEQGMNLLRGPMNPSTNDECGLLIQGFDDPPSVMMTYNPPYYAKLLENWGFKKAKDLNAYNISGQAKFADKVVAHAERLKSSGKVTFRSLNMKKFDQEVEQILELYNDAWETNWGFVPMDKAEFRHKAKDMKAIVDPNLVLLSEVNGKLAGFSLALPDVNQAIKKVRDGKLFPFGLIKLLWNAKGPGKKKTINRLRIITLGVKKEYQPIGLGPLLYMEYLTRGPRYGYNTGEASWILEDNKPMQRGIEYMQGKLSKVYRIYDRAIT